MPASFRSYLGSMGYNSVICYPSFNNASIDACSQSRIEKLSNSIDSLNPFEENRDVFASNIEIFLKRICFRKLGILASKKWIYVFNILFFRNIGCHRSYS